MGNLSPIPPFPGLTIPAGYPDVPQPGKIQLLFDANSHELYHRLSPYGTDTFLFIKSQQPFLYTYPDDTIDSMHKYSLQEFPFAAAIDDTIRIGKFLISGQGILFLAKQFLLQTGNAFNETRIYNPTSPVVAAAMPLTLWAVRPQRFIDISNGVGGIVGSFLGSSIGSIFTTGQTPPPGTAGLGALNQFNQNAGKGLIRAGTANPALANFNNTWAAGPASGAGLGIGGFLTGVIAGLFGNFLPQTQQGVKYRSDEGSYGIMVNAGAPLRFTYEGINGDQNVFSQPWIAGGTTMRKNNQDVPSPVLIMPQGPDGSRSTHAANQQNIIQIGPEPQSVSVGINRFGPFLGSTFGVRYGTAVGASVDPNYKASTMMLAYWSWLYPDQSVGTTADYPDKFTNPFDVQKIKDDLDRALADFRKSPNYTFDFPTDSAAYRSTYTTVDGYKRLVAMSSRNTPEVSYKFSALSDYRRQGTRVLENQFSSDPINKSLKMASSQQVDGLNILTVLDNSKTVPKAAQALIPGWTKWKPDSDDLVAFYFYDVVNQKYIPFRATPKGIQETDSINWEELAFIGRADRIYSYNGFNRSLTFNFQVQIGSLAELAPTYQRINYLMSLGKPATYTRRNTVNDPSAAYTRFIVPPMVMLTIGDLYRNHPIILGTVGFTVPETAVWEVENEINMPNGWEYLVNYIKSSNPNTLFAQVPRTVEMAISCYVLEKERAIVGAAHFGHAPHDETYTDNVFRATPPDFSSAPNKFDKNLIVFIGDSQKPPPPSQTATSTQPPPPQVQPPAPAVAPMSTQSAQNLRNAFIRAQQARLGVNANTPPATNATVGPEF